MEATCYGGWLSSVCRKGDVMRKLERLKHEALESAQFRGHTMRRFSNFGHKAMTDCIVCGAVVTVNARPLPNEIDIGGNAVAVHCRCQDTPDVQM